MSKAKFTLGDYLSAEGVSTVDTNLEQIVLLPLDQIDPDPDNFYSLTGLEDLAGNIETVGLLDPLRVRENGKRYTVVSGHRRRAACMLIRDGGNPMFDKGVPSIIERGDVSRELQELRLIFANSSTRVLTGAELSRQAERVTELLYQLSEQGVKFEGRMRDQVAAAVNTSKSRIGRLHAIRHNLHPDILKLFDSGVIKETTAYELQKLPQGVQAYLSNKKKVQTGDFAGDGAKLCVDMCDRYLHPSCTCPDGSSCTHIYPRFYQTLTSRWSDCRGMCCLKCHRGESECPYQCKESKKLTEERREKDRAEKAAAEEKRLKKVERNRKSLQKEYARLADLVKKAGLPENCVLDIEGAQSVKALYDVAQDPQAISEYKARDEHVFSRYVYLYHVQDFADKVNVSIDYLLGRTDNPEIGGGPSRTPAPTEETMPAWQTGDPDAEGWYCCWATWEPESKKWDPDREFLYWRGCSWFENDRDADRCAPAQYEVHKWYRIPDDPEEGG